MSKNSRKIIICLISLVITSWQQQFFAQTPWREKITRTKAWGYDHKELIELIECFSQIPEILAIGSNNALAIKTGALLNLTVTDVKILNELFKENNGCLIKQCMYNIPKTLAYFIAHRYEKIRLTSTAKEITPGSPEAKKLHSFKITQFFQFGVEVIFRLFAYIDARDEKNSGHPHLAKYLSEAADWVQLQRVINCFNTLDEQNPDLTTTILESEKQKL